MTGVQTCALPICKGLERASNRRHGVEEGRVGGIGPGLCLIEGRNRFDLDAGAGQGGQRRAQGFGGRAGGRRNIGAQRDENRAV